MLRLHLVLVAALIVSMTLGCERLEGLLSHDPPPDPVVAVPVPTAAPAGAQAPAVAALPAPVAPNAWGVTVSRDPAQIIEFLLPPVSGADQVAVFVFAADAATPAWTWFGPPARIRYGDPADLDPAIAQVLGEVARTRLAAPATYAAVALTDAGDVVATVPRRPL